MASYRGHLTFSTGLGIAYGGASWWFLQVDPALAGVAGVLTALGGLGYLVYGEFQDQRSSFPHPATAGLLQHEREPMKLADRPGRTPGPRRADVPASIPSRPQ